MGTGLPPRGLPKIDRNFWVKQRGLPEGKASAASQLSRTSMPSRYRSPDTEVATGQ